MYVLMVLGMSFILARPLASYPLRVSKIGNIVRCFGALRYLNEHNAYTAWPRADRN